MKSVKNSLNFLKPAEEAAVKKDGAVHNTVKFIAELNPGFAILDLYSSLRYGTNVFEEQMSVTEAAFGFALSAVPFGVGFKGASSEIKIFGSLTEKFGKSYKSVSVARDNYVAIGYGQSLNAASRGSWNKIFEAGYLKGSKVEIHYFYNSTTGQYANPFIKMSNWGSKVMNFYF